MPRPKCRRRIGWFPECWCFQPVSRGSSKEAINLELDELEALRLADFLGLYQEQAAEKMGVSRATFGRILESAHHKVAGALVEGKVLMVNTKGGNIMVVPRRTFVCYECNHRWQVPYGGTRPGVCPVCSSRDIHRAPEERGWHGRGGPGWGRCRWPQQVSEPVEGSKKQEETK